MACSWWGHLPHYLDCLHIDMVKVLQLSMILVHPTGCPKVTVGTFTEDNSVIDRVNAKSFEPLIVHTTGIFSTYDTPWCTQNHPGFCWKQFHNLKNAETRCALLAATLPASLAASLGCSVADCGFSNCQDCLECACSSADRRWSTGMG